MQIAGHRISIGLSHIVKHISAFMSPAALHGYLWINHRLRCQQPLTAIGDNQLKPLLRQAPVIEISEEDLPGPLGFSRGDREINYLFCAPWCNSQSYQDQSLHRASSALTLEYDPLKDQQPLLSLCCSAMKGRYCCIEALGHARHRRGANGLAGFTGMPLPSGKRVKARGP